MGDVVDLPLGPEEEVDVEGLDRTDGHLWIVGSHSRTRKQVNDGDGADEALDALTKLDVEGIVALDDAVLIGLRGPVLRGWAVALFGGWPAVGHLFARVRR